MVICATMLCRGGGEVCSVVRCLEVDDVSARGSESCGSGAWLAKGSGAVQCSTVQHRRQAGGMVLGVDMVETWGASASWRDTCKARGRGATKSIL